MTDLDLLVIGATVTFLAVSGAYVAIRHRANEAPVPSYKTAESRRRLEAEHAVAPASAQR